jgi:hypothetical protein
VFLCGQCRGVVLKSWKRGVSMWSVSRSCLEELERGVSMWSVSRSCLEELETGCFYMVSVEELS